MIGTHVDDDLIAGSGKFFSNHVAQLRKMHCCRGCHIVGHTGDWGFHHSGRFLQLVATGPNRMVNCAQEEYSASVEPIPSTRGARVTFSEASESTTTTTTTMSTAPVAP